VLVVRLEARRLALPVEFVQRVLPAMAAEPLHRAPAVVEGVINLHGRAVPLLDLRVRLGLAPRPVHPDDHVVVCTVADRTVGLRVDATEAVTRVRPEQMVPAQEVATADHLAGAAVLDDGLLFVYDVRSFLAADEVLQLEAALAAHPGEPS
jgi:purine-binding chemotaxis protein CheW